MKSRDTGITINKEIIIKSIMEDNLPLYVSAVKIIIIYLAVLCSVFSFVDVMGLDVKFEVVYIITLVAVILEYIVFKVMNYTDNILLAMVLMMIYFGIAVIYRTKIFSGLIMFIEKYIDNYNVKYGTNLVLNIKVDNSNSSNIIVLVLIVALLVSLIISYLVIVKMNKMLYLIVSGIWTVLGYFVGIEPSMIFFVSYIIVSFVILGVEQMSKNNLLSKCTTSKEQKILMDIAHSKIEIVVCIFAVIILIIYSMAWSKKEYKSNNYVKNISAGLRNGVQKLINDTVTETDAFGREIDTNNLKLNEMINASPVLNNGVFSEGGIARYYNNGVFRVVTNEINDTMYLKQYVGLIYKNGWISKNLDEEKLNNCSSNENILKENFQFHIKSLPDSVSYNIVSIKTQNIGQKLIPIGASKDYKLGKNGIVEYNENDVEVVAGYEVEFQHLYKCLEKIDSKSMDNASNAEKNYMDVPKELRKSIENVKPYIDKYIKIIKDIDKGNFKNETVRRKVIIRALVNYFNYNYQYTLKPGKTPKGKDPVEYFLIDNKKGYCMYFAAAATAILRAYDIPTRYVEGYVVRNNDCEKGTRVETLSYVEKLEDYNTTLYDFRHVPLYEYNVNDTNGHAWVEVYINNVGWIPVEVTPIGVGGSISDNNDEVATDNNTVGREDMVKDEEKQQKIKENSKKEKSEKENIEKIIRDKKAIVIVVSILLIASILVFVLNREKKDSNRNIHRQLYRKDKLAYACKMSMYILEKKGMKFRCDYKYKDYAKYLTHVYSEYSKNEYEDILNNILKYKYGNCLLDNEEEQMIFGFYNFLYDKYFNDMKRGKRRKECYKENYIIKI